MDTYKIEIHGETVKASVVDDLAMVGIKIDELEPWLQALESRIVGLDIKLDNAKFVLVLCVGTCCLIIRSHIAEVPPEALRVLMANNTICFLSTKMVDMNLFSLRLRCSTVVQLGYFASKCLKKAHIKDYGLAELACDVGMDMKESIISECLDWSAEFFTLEQIKYAVHDAYTTYVIGKKLLNML
ncbi:uncharacterized protein LOC115980395 [Quercus lobata]|nr:uncharacterized protein LOC115980395 [Quercus lobata]